MNLKRNQEILIDLTKTEIDDKWMTPQWPVRQYQTIQLERREMEKNRDDVIEKYTEKLVGNM